MYLIHFHWPSIFSWNLSIFSCYLLDFSESKNRLSLILQFSMYDLYSILKNWLKVFSLKQVQIGTYFVNSNWHSYSQHWNVKLSALALTRIKLKISRFSQVETCYKFGSCWIIIYLIICIKSMWLSISWVKTCSMTHTNIWMKCNRLLECYDDKPIVGSIHIYQKNL